MEVSDDLIADEGEQGTIDILEDIFEHKIDDWDPFNVEVSKVTAGEIVLEPVGYA